eukprot:Hpha_TRINITY_DN13794_c0_g1::TRINITY_DN13794_c0_g1_i1::g.142475::m.142475
MDMDADLGVDPWSSGLEVVFATEWRNVSEDRLKSLGSCLVEAGRHLGSHSERWYAGSFQEDVVCTDVAAAVQQHAGGAERCVLSFTCVNPVFESRRLRQVLASCMYSVLPPRERAQITVLVQHTSDYD